jgi:hypothetical protein
VKHSENRIIRINPNSKVNHELYCSHDTRYRVCHGFRLTKRDDYFAGDFDLFKLSMVFRGSWDSLINWLEP